MIQSLLRTAEQGTPLWLPDLRLLFAECPEARPLILRIRGNGDACRDYRLFLPPAASSKEEAFLLRYVSSSLYNILSALSAREITIFCDEQTRALLSPLPALFETQEGFGKVRCIARRIHGAFEISFAPPERFSPVPVPAVPDSNDLGARLRAVCRAAEEKGCVGVDVGGSDIKLAASLCGKLLYTKEYDWNPASSPTAEGIVEPILDLIREARFELEKSGGRLDAVGISFPDIVISDRIVGGETPKTKGMRDNPSLDYEREFTRLRDLKDAVLSLCAPGAHVRLTNDGNMAAFSAAAELSAGGADELIAGGVVAHSLGTDLGTGWLCADGTIPPLPLELYDLLLDLGDAPSASLPSADLRSTRNENSVMNGLRRYLGQAAAYRLAWRLDPTLLDGFISRSGEILSIPTAPADLRKPCLEHLMRCATEGRPEAEEIFREIGRSLAQATREMNWIFGATPPQRFLFGRFVKSRRCFDLLCDGFREVLSSVSLAAADDELANTALMKQLSATPSVSVAQFAQAVGAIYYAFD